MDTNEQLIRAVHLATRKLVSTGDFDQLLREVLGIAVEAVGAAGGTIYLHDPANRRLVFHHVIPDDVASKLPFKDMPDDAGVAGQVFQTRKTQISEFTESNEQTRRQVETATGVITRTMITVPLMMEHEPPIGVVQLINKKSGSFNETDMAVLDTVAAVSTMAALNARLVEEASRASTLLGMGKVGHDIGNLAGTLFANIAFAEMAIKGLNQHLSGRGKSAELARMYLESLREMYCELKASIERIVGYSRLISDLSAGRELRPNKVLAPLADTIHTAAAFMESDARKNRVAVRYDIQEGAPPLLHDDLYVFRIVQNLVGNAIKAVREVMPEGWGADLTEEDDAVFGEVLVRYKFQNGNHVIEVHDSGPGISNETIDRILAGTARSQWDKAAGSGWGTKIVLELAATHSGSVSIDSEVGKGTTFRVCLPAAPIGKP